MLYCLWANTRLPAGSESTETAAQSKQRRRGRLLSCTPEPNPPYINLITPAPPLTSNEQSRFLNNILQMHIWVLWEQESNLDLSSRAGASFTKPKKIHPDWRTPTTKSDALGELESALHLFIPDLFKCVFTGWMYLVTAASCWALKELQRLKRVKASWLPLWFVRKPFPVKKTFFCLGDFSSCLTSTPSSPAPSLFSFHERHVLASLSSFIHVGSLPLCYIWLSYRNLNVY